MESRLYGWCLSSRGAIVCGSQCGFGFCSLWLAGCTTWLLSGGCAQFKAVLRCASLNQNSSVGADATGCFPSQIAASLQMSTLFCRPDKFSCHRDRRALIMEGLQLRGHLMVLDLSTCRLPAIRCSLFCFYPPRRPSFCLCAFGSYSCLSSLCWCSLRKICLCRLVLSLHNDWSSLW